MVFTPTVMATTDGPTATGIWRACTPETGTTETATAMATVTVTATATATATATTETAIAMATGMVRRSTASPKLLPGSSERGRRDTNPKESHESKFRTAATSRTGTLGSPGSGNWKPAGTGSPASLRIAASGSLARMDRSTRRGIEG